MWGPFTKPLKLPFISNGIQCSAVLFARLKELQLQNCIHLGFFSPLSTSWHWAARHMDCLAAGQIVACSGTDSALVESESGVLRGGHRVWIICEQFAFLSKLYWFLCTFGVSLPKKGTEKATHHKNTVCVSFMSGWMIWLFMCNSLRFIHAEANKKGSDYWHFGDFLNKGKTDICQDLEHSVVWMLH